MRSFYNNRYGCHSFDLNKDDKPIYDSESISNPNKSKYNITNDEANYFHTIKKKKITNPINMKFPTNFRNLGLSTAAYQIEGGRTEEGGGLCNWDTYMYSGNAALTVTGQYATEFYYGWKDDIDRLYMMGVKTFRFSISWARIFPNGEDSGKPNQGGIDFYRKVLERLIWRGITPVICLMHWDMPSGLTQKLVATRKNKPVMVGLSFKPKDRNEWYNNKINDNSSYDTLDNVFMKSWIYYCKAVFKEIIFYKEFYKKIYYISSINEITTIANNAYFMGQMAPGISFDRSQCDFGDWNSSYWALYNLIRMHAIAYHTYKEYINDNKQYNINDCPKFTADNTLLTLPLLKNPNNNIESDQKGYIQAIDWNVKIVFDPMINGEWSKSIYDFFYNGNQKGSIDSWRGSFPPGFKEPSPYSNPSYKVGFDNPEATCDIIAYHYYNSKTVEYNSDSLTSIMKGYKGGVDTNKGMQRFVTDPKYGPLIYSLWNIDGHYNQSSPIIYNSPLGPGTIPNSQGWTGFYPEGMGIAADLLYDLYGKPNNLDIIQSESGTAEAVAKRISIYDSVRDTIRVDFFSRSLNSLITSKACKDGKVTGCLFWSLCDNVEWMSGTAVPFGSYYCNFWGNGQYAIRNPKMSAGWFASSSFNKQVISYNDVKDNINIFTPPLNNAFGPSEFNKKPLNTLLLGNYLTTYKSSDFSDDLLNTNNELYSRFTISSVAANTNIPYVKVGEITYPLMQMGEATSNAGKIRPNQFRSYEGPMSVQYDYSDLQYTK